MSCAERFFKRHYEDLVSIANKTVGAENGNDLVNDLYLELVRKKKLQGLCERDELFKYMARAIKICGFSNRTPYYNKYKRLQKLYVDEYDLTRLVETSYDEKKNNLEIENHIQAVFLILQEIRWFDAEIFKAYYLHEHSITTLSDATEIPKSTIYQAIQKAKKHLEKNADRIRRHCRTTDPDPNKESGTSYSRRGLRLRGT